ncbi:MAG: hypothetical protein LBD11_00520 [Candidatus Peribacteria bacterium]|jgi:hypothetical protein|nr:hypothetical protein [Candidatus Peribacteria bacterium]
MGTVNYQLKDNDQFKFIVKPATYTGETEVLVKDVDENLDIKDNGVVIGNLSGGVVSNVASSYSITYNGTTKELDIILQTLSSTGNIIEGITPTMTNPSNPTNPTSPS